MLVTVVLIALSTLLFVWGRRQFWVYPRAFPPGPRASLPIIGEAYLLGKQYPEGLSKLHEKFGKVIGLDLAGHLAVSASDFDFVIESMCKLYFILPDFDHDIKLFIAKNELQGRPFGPGLALYKKGPLLDGTNGGIILGEGPTQIQSRRFVLK